MTGIQTVDVTTNPAISGGGGLSPLDVVLTLPDGGDENGLLLLMYARSYPTIAEGNEHLPAELLDLGWVELFQNDGWWWKRYEDVSTLSEEFSLPSAYDAVEAVVELISGWYDDDGPVATLPDWGQEPPAIQYQGWGHVRWYGSVEAVEGADIVSSPSGYEHVGTSEDSGSGLTIRVDMKSGLDDTEAVDPYILNPGGESGIFFVLRGMDAEPPPPVARVVRVSEEIMSMVSFEEEIVSNAEDVIIEITHGTDEISGGEIG